MMKHPILLALAGIVVVATGSGLARSDARSDHFAPEPTWDTIAERFGGTKADTRPSRDVPMSFSLPVEVRVVAVKGGQSVKKGDLLIRARDDDQVAVVEGQRLQAANMNRIRNAELQKELADLNFQRIKEAKEKGSFSPVEFDQRRIEAAAAAVTLEQEKVTHELEVKRLDQAEGLLARYRLVAQWDGIVEEVRVEEGQGVKDTEPVIRLVNIDNLWIETYAQTEQTIRDSIREGTEAWVLIALPDKPRIVTGKVLYVSPVADSVSQTRRVRVEVKNTEGWPAGTPAMVRFNRPGAEWNEYMLKPAGKPVSGAAPAPASPTVTSASDAR